MKNGQDLWARTKGKVAKLSFVALLITVTAAMLYTPTAGL